MYTDFEDSEDIDNIFFNALALLHSTENDSTEKLRKMLDATIERKHGFGKTLMARMPKRFLQSSRIRTKSTASENTNRRDNIFKQKIRSESQRSMKHENQPPLINNATENNSKLIIMHDETLNVESEDYFERGDIPRISIPDEGSGDGLLCKICNGAKLGPLILLECQECQDVYHPLCHQPPVVDIDVYDPRIVWRCRKCVEMSSVMPSTFTIEEKKVKKLRSPNGTINVKETTTKVDKTRKTDISFRKKENCFEGHDLTGGTQKSISTLHEKLVKSSSNLLQKHIKTTNQLKKRIGSKLSVTRGTTKQC